jgi:hypothetical protein
MLKKYKNGFFDLIQKSGFDPKLFDVSEETIHDHDGFIITVRNSLLKFIARNNKLNRHELDCSYTRFLKNFPQAGYFPQSGWEDIEFVYTHFEKWLKEDLQDYLDEAITPDLWEQANFQRPLMSTAGFEKQDTSNYSDEEKAQLRLALSEFRLLIAENFKPTEEQMHVIDERLDYVSSALDRLNRFDWKSILLSTTISISIALSLDTARGKLLFDLLRRVLSNVLYLLQ